MIDGLGQSELPAGMEWPTVKGWLKPDGQTVDGEECIFTAKGPYYIDIIFMGQYAVIPKCEPVK
jgi:hypothetical protein